MDKCLCGSKQAYTVCCQPLHLKKQNASTAAQLMAARYVAHALGLVDFIVETTHFSTRSSIDLAALRDWLKSIDWQQLEIIKTSLGQPSDSLGKVEFKAYYIDNQNKKGLHHELSRFKKVGEKWYFVDGKTPRKSIFEKKKIGKNSPCICGSGKKYKQCCAKKMR